MQPTLVEGLGNLEIDNRYGKAGGSLFQDAVFGEPPMERLQII